MKGFLLTTLVSVSFFTAVSSTVFAYTVDNPPPGFSIQTVVAGLETPTSLVFAPDGGMFVALKEGKVVYVKDGIISDTPVIVLPHVNNYSDRGLLSIAIAPTFPAKRFMYLLYTYENNPANPEGPKTAQLLRVTLDANNVAIAGSELVLLGKTVGDATHPSCVSYPSGADCISSDSPSHSIADLKFAPDGKLFVSIGDGSNFDNVDPLAHRALDLTKLNGKVLRINPATGAGYKDNPYYKTNLKINRSKVWNLGLRNPFRMSFRPSNGSLYIGDVGWNTFEELNIGTKGANFGWPCREGGDANAGYPAPGKNCGTSGYTNPLYAYTHTEASGGAIVGGLFYQGVIYPEEYQGTYFFGDFSQDFIKRIVVDANDNFVSVENFIETAGGPVAFASDANGDIYYISIYSGEIRKIVYVGDSNRAPIAKIIANPTSGSAPLEVGFIGSQSSDPDGDAISYLWNFGDSVTSNEADPIHVYENDGDFTVTLSVTDTAGNTTTESQHILVGNEAPTSVITAPTNESVYTANQTISLSAVGFDNEDGILPESAYNWKLILHHNVHVHILQELSGSQPTFIAPDHGTDSDVYLEVELTVTDSAGLTHKNSINMRLLGSVASCASDVSHVVLYSDTSNITSSGANAVFTYNDIGWDVLINGAKWIWNAFYVATPATGEVETFTKTFTISGTPTGATLILGADDFYQASLNGVQFAGVSQVNNFSSGKQDAYDITNLLQKGENTLSVTVTNIATGDIDPKFNPAGLLYKLDVSQNSCQI